MPMNKTIYLRDEDVPIWERARELSGDKLSPVILAALKQFVTGKETEAKGFERIVLEFDDAENHHVRKRIAFYGKWIFPRHEPYRPVPFIGIVGRPVPFGGSVDVFSNNWNCAVAITAKGNAVFFSWEETPGGDSEKFEFKYFDSLERAAREPSLNKVARRAIETLGVPIEELDI